MARRLEGMGLCRLLRLGWKIDGMDELCGNVMWDD